jgi:hypothetical protein
MVDLRNGQNTKVEKEGPKPIVVIILKSLFSNLELLRHKITHTGRKCFYT